MKNLQKGFIIPLLIAIIVVLGIGGVSYIYLQKQKINKLELEKKIVEDNDVFSTTTANTTVQSTSSSINLSKNLYQSKNYSLPCGVNIGVKTNQPVSTSTYNNGSMFSLHVGAQNTTQANMFINCSKRTEDSLEVAKVISVQADKSQEVSKDDYLVFDAQTLSLIPKLYSSKNYGYTTDSEVIGFEYNGWIYGFYFLNPEQARNKNSFEISIIK
jgi:hypothetical protein